MALSFAPVFKPLVSIVIPCLNEESAIADCLRSILLQTYPRSRTEVLVVDGGSTDRTLLLVREIAALFLDARIKIVKNPDRVQSAGCNYGIIASRGSVIIRMDAHARYHPEYVARSVRALKATGADNVGGAARAVYRTYFQRAMAAALGSQLAVGGSAYRQRAREGFVDTVWNGAFRRSVFETAGLFDPRAVANEDAELNLRITKRGGLVFLARDVIAYYFPRRSPWALARQYYRYGEGRARTTVKHRALQSLRPLAPFFLVSTVCLLLLVSPLLPLAREALVTFLFAYAAIVLGETARLAARHGASLAPALATIFPIIHFAHGAGFASGLVRYALFPDWSASPQRLAAGTGDLGEAR